MRKLENVKKSTDFQFRMELEMKFHRKLEKTISEFQFQSLQFPIPVTLKTPYKKKGKKSYFLCFFS